MIDELLERARRVCQEAEVFYLSAEETPVSFEANRLKLLQSRQSHGLALRIIKDGRLGFAATTDVSPTSARALVEAALEVAPFGAEARFGLPSPQAYVDVAVYDPATAAYSVEAMVELGQQLIDGVRGHTPELLCDAGVGKTVFELRLVNSNGASAAYRKTVFGVGLHGTLVRGTDMLFVGDSESSCAPIESIDAIVADTVRQLELARETAPAPTGEVPVVFTPWGVAAALLYPLLVAFNGKNVLMGSSPLAGRLGERVFDARLSVADDATLALRPASRPCDDEGVPARRVPLIEGGVVASFLYDLQTAGRAGVASTGSAHRSLASQPTPSTTAVVIAPGEAPFEAMLADIDTGIVVERLMGAEQGNILSGDFSGNIVLGYRVERGRIVGRVKDAVLSGNVYRAMADIAAIGSEPRWVGGGLYCPPLYCRGLSVAAKG